MNDDATSFTCKLKDQLTKKPIWLVSMLNIYNFRCEVFPFRVCITVFNSNGKELPNLSTFLAHFYKTPPHIVCPSVCRSLYLPTLIAAHKYIAYIAYICFVPISPCSCLFLNH